MDIDGGGWTVFQRRINGEVTFTRDWESYAQGFGDIQAEHWLGNRQLHAITSESPHELRVDLKSFGGQTAYATYSEFSVGPEDGNFVLHVDKYKGTAGDSLASGVSLSSRRHNGQPFTTFDRDNDKQPNFNCAEERGSGWWYNDCLWASLNGQYQNAVTVNAIVWRSWKDANGLKGCQMMMRPVNAG